jgi:hypothetical protein
MQRPGQFQDATQFAGMAGQGGLDSAQQAYGYGEMGAGYGQRAANIGEMALQAQDYGRMIGSQAQNYAAQSAGIGNLYEQMATDPRAYQAYMSPYQQAVTDIQLDAARRNADIAAQGRKTAATRAGAFGGSRQAIENAEANRALQTQLDSIQAQGLQNAYTQAQGNINQRAMLGLQGLSGAQTGLGTALQGGQLGLSGIGQAIAGQQAGMQGAQTGLQGVSGAQAGYGLANQAGVNLANIGTAQQQADIARMGFQNDVGAMQRQREQDIINQAINTYGQQQENPFNRMSQYSGLIRGYYTPNYSQTTYQAQPALGSQLAGFGTAAYAASQKRKGGRIKESDGIDKLALYKTMKRLEGV